MVALGVSFHSMTIVWTNVHRNLYFGTYLNLRVSEGENQVTIVAGCPRASYITVFPFPENLTGGGYGRMIPLVTPDALITLIQSGMFVPVSPNASSKLTIVVDSLYRVLNPVMSSIPWYAAEAKRLKYRKAFADVTMISGLTPPNFHIGKERPAADDGSRIEFSVSLMVRH